MAIEEQVRAYGDTGFQLTQQVMNRFAEAIQAAGVEVDRTYAFGVAMEHPEAGDIIPGSGGVRKLRWNRKGMGKRGDLRVIYFVRYQPNEFWLLTLYAKAKQENVPAHLFKQLKEAFEHG